MKRTVATGWLVVCVLVCVWAAAWSAGVNDAGRNTVLVRVNGQAVTQFEIDQMISDDMAKLKGQLAGAPLEVERQNLMRTALSRRQETLLLVQEANRKLEKPRLEQIDRIVDDQINELVRKESKVRLEARLRDNGLTVDDLRKDMREQLIVRAYVTERIIKQINVAPSMIREQYARNIDKYRYPRTITARIIFLSYAKCEKPDDARNEGQRLYVALTSGGADFARLADEKSNFHGDGPNGTLPGGLLKDITQPYLADPAVDKVLFSLKPGTVSEPIVTQKGVYLLKAESESPARLAPLEEVQDAINNELHEQQKQDLLNKVLKDLYANADIRQGRD